MVSETETVFVIPPSRFLADERVFPTLGPLKVAAALEAKGERVGVLDLSGIDNHLDVVTIFLETNGKNAKRVGITATTPQFPAAVQIAELVRSRKPELKLIFGGPHATMVASAREHDQKKGVRYRGSQAYDQMLSFFDTVVTGDGEEAIHEAVREESPQVIDATSQKSPLFLKRGTLEQYPFPNRDLIDLSSYHYEIDGKDAQSLIAQLGCPFECGFCAGRETAVFRVARSRSVESVLSEVDLLVKKYGKKGVMFYDDELNINNETLMQLMDSLIKYQKDNGVDLRLRGFVKAELFTPEQAKAMYQAGFRVLLSGIESGDIGILNTMRKHTTPEINARLVRYCHETRLRVKALMSIGHPGETEESVANSLKWVLENKPDVVDWTIITEFPGSPYFDQSVPHEKEEGVWIYSEPRSGNVLYSKAVDFARKAEYYKGVPGDYTSYVWTESLPPQKLVSLRDRCEITSRTELGLPLIVPIPARQFEHSMGQRLPSHILRTNSDFR